MNSMLRSFRRLQECVWLCLGSPKARWCLHSALFVLVTMTVACVGQSAIGEEIDKRHAESVGQAISQLKAMVAPVKPRRLLVMSKCSGFEHGSRTIGCYAFPLMGEKTGAFEATVSDDVAMFDPENLAKFDAILFNNANAVPVEDAARRQAVVDFVKNGKGIIAVHAAIQALHGWPEADNMIGGTMDGHPWTRGKRWAIKVDEPDHKLNAAFGGKGFLIDDEIFQFGEPYSREKLRVLLSLDMSNPRNLQVKTDSSNYGMHRDDRDFAVAWIKSVGQGRVFYSALGHQYSTFWNPDVMQYLLNGIQYALGDLKVDDRPSAALEHKPQPALTTAPGMPDEPFASLLTYHVDQSRVSVLAIEEMIRKGDSQQCIAVEENLLELLGYPVVSYDCQQVVCRLLSLCGSQRCVPAMAKLLLDKELSHMARYVLQGLPTSKADEALRKALGELSGELRIGVISTLAARGGAESVAALFKLLDDKDPATVRAVVVALGRMVNTEADAKRLLQTDVPSTLKDIWANAALSVAGRLAAADERPAAARVYRQLFEGDNPLAVRIAALRGLVESCDPEAGNLLLAAIKGDNRDLAHAAAGFVNYLPQPSSLTPFLKALPELTEDSKVALIASLAATGTSGLEAEFMALADDDSEFVRIAAMRGLQHVGGIAAIPLLARKAASDTGQVREAAQLALVRMSVPGVAETLMASMEGAEPAQAVVLISTLAARRVTAANPLLLQLVAQHQDKLIRDEAVKALKTMGRAEDLPALVKLLEKIQPAEQDDLVQAIVAVGLRQTDEDKRIEPVLAALAGAPLALKAVLLRVAGGLGGTKALAVIQAAMNDPDENVHDAVVRALVGWPDDSVAEELLKIAKDGENRKHRILALQAYIRLAAFAVENQRVTDAMTILRTAGALCQRPEDKRFLLGVLSGLRSVLVMELALTYLNDPEVTNEAAAALVDIAKALGPENTQDVTRAMEQVLAVSKDEALCKEARKYIRKEIKEAK